MYIFDEKRLLHPTELRYARELADRERINPLTEGELFKSCIYTILSIRENYAKQMKMFDELKRNGLDTPHSILENQELMTRITKKSMRKPELVYNFSKWWVDSDWKSRFLEDMLHGGKNWYDLRGELAENSHGMSYKSASLVVEMCGCDDVVVADVWTLRYLIHHGLIPERFDKQKVKRGITKKEYLTIIEPPFMKKAEEFSTKPAILRRCIWVKNSTWSRTKGGIDQLVLALNC
jgi:thermostable 8-oxoguanine DNA glycosylase